MKNYTPYKFWTKTHLAEHLLDVAHKLDMGVEVRLLIEAAVKSDLWDPRTDFDGCTIVQDMFHPCVSCFLHDYLWKTGQGGRDADLLFYCLMRLEGATKGRARRRWLGVRMGWFFYYKWNHFANRNVNKPTKEFTDALMHLLLIKKPS